MPRVKKRSKKLISWIHEMGNRGKLSPRQIHDAKVRLKEFDHACATKSFRNAEKAISSLIREVLNPDV